MSPPPVRPLADLLGELLDPLFLRLRQRRLQQLCRSYERHLPAGRQPRDGPGWQAVHGLRWRQVDQAIAELAELDRRLASGQRDYAELEVQLGQAANSAERDFLLRRFVATHHRAARGLRPDIAATRRGFDAGALHEQLQAGWSEDDIDREVHLAVIAVAVADEVGQVFAVPAGAAVPLREQLDASGCLDLLGEVAESEAWWRFRVVALRGLGLVAQALPAERWATIFPPAVHARIFRLCYRTTDPVWVQIAALRALRACDEDQWQAVAAQRLAEGALRKDDDLFVRHALVGDLATARDRVRAITSLAGSLTPADISDRVRQGALRSLCRLPLDQTLPYLQRAFGLLRGADADPCAAVRAAGLVTILERLTDFDLAEASGRPEAIQRSIAHNLIQQVLLYERHPLVLRALLDRLPGALVLHDAGPRCEIRRPFQPPLWCEALVQAIDALSTDGALPLALRREAQECREAVVVRCLPDGSRWLAWLAERIRRIPEGGRRHVRLPPDAPGWPVLARLLVALTRRGFGLSLRRTRRGLLVQHGDRFQPAWWRLWYEFRHPGPDKRHGFTHGIGRRFAGPDRFHPLLLGEESPTKVPGEPVYCDDEGQWRRYLPLIDDLMDLARGVRGERQVRLHAAQGTVTCSGPRGWFAKRRLQARLLRQAGDLVRLRQLALSDLAEGTERHPYVDRIERLGISVRFQPHGWLDQRQAWHPLVDPTLMRYFGLPLIGRPEGAQEVIGAGAPGITLISDLRDLPDAAPEGDESGMDQVATERARRTATVARRVGHLHGDIAAAVAAAGLDDAEMLDQIGTEALLSAASDRLRRTTEEADRIATEAQERGAADVVAAVAEHRRGERQAEDDLPTDRIGTSAVAAAASERLRRRVRHTSQRISRPEPRERPTDGQDDLATERQAGSGTGSAPSSRRSSRHQRLVEERSDRDTMEYHRSVTQQLRRLREGGVQEGIAAEAGAAASAADQAEDRADSRPADPEPGLFDSAELAYRSSLLAALPEHSGALERVDGEDGEPGTGQPAAARRDETASFDLLPTDQRRSGEQEAITDDERPEPDPGDAKDGR